MTSLTSTRIADTPGSLRSGSSSGLACAAGVSGALAPGTGCAGDWQMPGTSSTNKPSPNEDATHLWFIWKACNDYKPNAAVRYGVCEERLEIRRSLRDRPQGAGFAQLLKLHRLQ